MRIIDCDQRSTEWFSARLGRLTASRAADMLATIKSGEAADRRNLRVQLVLERLTGTAQEEGYVSTAMQQGIEREGDALLWYEAQAGALVQRSGFLAHDTLMAGASLDGHLGAFEVIIEAKCPMPATHLEYLKTGTVPSKYVAQVTHQLWITGARECHWLSFQPDFPEALRAKLAVIPRDEKAIAEYEQKARAFLAEVDREVEALRTMADPRAAFAAVGA